SQLYSNLQNKIKDKFAKSYYILPHKYIKSWLYSLSTFRNICAHYGRTYNKPLIIKPLLDKKDIARGIRNESLFSVLFIIHKLIKDTSEWHSFVITLKALIDQYSNIIDTSLMGFPNDWEQLFDI